MKKSVLITGCSKGGIGDALAQEFHRKGLRVFATARDLAKIEHLKALGLDVFQLDVTSQDSIGNAVAEVQRVTGGTLDFLVNNAGAGFTVPLLDVDLAAARKLFDLNVFSVLAVTQAFAPCLIAAKGKVINIGSIVGKLVLPYTGIYNSSKAAVNLLSETLRVELAPFDVQVITVITGVIESSFFTNQGSISLPKDSRYLPVQDTVRKIAAGQNDQDERMPAAVFAAGVVANALKTKPSLWYWRGAKTWVVWLVTTFMAHTFPDAMFSKAAKLDELKKLLRSGEK